MKSIRTTLALVSLAAAGFAQAQQVTPFPTGTSMQTRAAVIAETRRAMAAGEHMWGNQGPNHFGAVRSTRDSAAVRAEAQAAVRLSPSEALHARLLNGV